MNNDLISREALKGVIETYRPALIYDVKTDTKSMMVDFFLDEIDNAEAVPERPKGEWIEQTDYIGDIYYECSVCKEPWTTIDGTPMQNMMNFCPNCGADMRGGAE